MRLPKMTSPRSFHRSPRTIAAIFSILLLAVAIFALRAVNIDTLSKIGITPQSRAGKLLAQIAPQAFASKFETAIRLLKDRGQYDSLRQAMETARYRANAEPQRAGEFAALNPAQKLHTRFTPQGVEVRRHSDEATPKLAMTLRGVGYGERQLPVSSGTVSAQGQRIEIHRTIGESIHSAFSTQRSALTEWYVNQPTGLEQGFTLAEPPGERRAGERLELTLALMGDLQPQLSADGQSVTFGGTYRYDHLVVRDAAGQTLPARMRLRAEELRLEVEDAGASWPLTIDPTLAQEGRLATDVDDNLSESSAGDAEAAYFFAPVITITSSMSILQGDNATSVFNSITVSDTSAGNLDVSVMTIPTGLTWTSSSLSAQTIFSITFDASCTATLGANTVVLKVTNQQTGQSATGNLTVNVSAAPPTTANAGPDQALCVGAQATLAANTASVGTGAWTVVSTPAGGSTSTAQFGNRLSPTSTFTPVVGTGTYILRWTITGLCATSTNDVQLTFSGPNAPTTANAGPDQTLCGTSATLAANTPSVGTGAWTVVSGPSTLASQFSSTSSPTATFTAAGGPGAYALRWTISSASCADSTNDVVLNLRGLPTIALGASPSVVTGTTSANLPYTAKTFNPTQYSINYDTAANTAGFVDVFQATLPASPIVLVVPSAAAVGTYNATLTVRNTTTGCVSSSTPFTVTVTSFPPTLGNYSATSINLGAQATVTPGAAPTDTTSLVATASSGFNGTFDANPTTGVIKIINAHPAGTYTVTATAFGSGGSTSKTFTLTVQSGTACAATPVFSSSPNVSVGSPFEIAVGDFNHDGKQDLAIANTSSASISIRLGDGGGGFTGTTTVSTGVNPFAIAVGDFNGDGNQDLAVACTSAGVVSIRLGDGAGNFSGTTDITAGSSAKSIAVGDFNGDGKLDFVTANFGADTASVRFGDGVGGFNGSTNVSVGDGPGQIRVGDFDGDGDLDFVISNQNASTVSVRLNDGAGNFSGTSRPARSSSLSKRPMPTAARARSITR